MTTNRSNWLQRAATIVILIALLIPMFFGGVRSVQAEVPFTQMIAGLELHQAQIQTELGQQPSLALIHLRPYRKRLTPRLMEIRCKYSQAPMLNKSP